MAAPDPTLDEFRAEVRAVIARELPRDFAGVGSITDHDEAERFVERWRATLARENLIGVTWPVEYGGRGLDRTYQVVLVEELARAGVPYGVPSDTYGLKMLANTLLRFGTTEQKARFLPAIRSGELRWCQGFSEPGAGSDLAALRTRARREGDELVIDGQKIWTSNAQQAHWIFLLARTDPEAIGHRGISFLLVPLDQPGIDIRPIRTMTGEASFCEVFLTGARTAADCVVGEVGAGWQVATALLGFERGEEAATNPILFRAELQRLIALAQGLGMAHETDVRLRLAECVAEVEVMSYLGESILERLSAGEELAGGLSSVTKLQWSEYHRRATTLAIDLLGIDGVVDTGRRPLRHFRADDPGAPTLSTASWNGAWMNALAGTIYAGTSQIQRDIIAATALGLPRDSRR